MVQNAGVDRGSVEIDLEDSDSDSSSSEDSLTKSKRSKEVVSNEAVFKKLKNNPAARASLSSIHAARTFKYGHVQFGPKSWYRESANVSEKLTSQEDRRKFRQGLKCNVDFLNQLNMHDLMKHLLDGKQEISSLPKSITGKLEDIFGCLKNTPLIEILKLIDSEKAQKLFACIDKIVALAHVSQSMGNYFARDDAIDPALSTVCQALRGNIDFEHILRSRGGTFQSLASAYYHLKSPADRDLRGSTTNYRAPKETRRGDTSGRRPSGSKVCWFFQKNGRCSRQNCWFAHRCTRCGSKNHGEKSCRIHKSKNWSPLTSAQCWPNCSHQ